ncbi:extracellular matrix protein 1 [Megalops cyprinoides]|uniref:extracellular matrix protein 1 n=1 Tax=Megalops cyprinoides TaxID=118141 RepID=UPI00186518FB|nr:extracellular matrix protein 1 [Megalops cyprinoides]
MGSVILESLWIVVALLAFGCLALEDEPDIAQREVTFDLSEILGVKGASQPDPHLAQREVTFDLEDLWEPIELPEADPDVNQRDVTFDLPKILRERGSRRDESDMTQREVTLELDSGFKDMGPPVFGPRSFREPRVPFPPARPSSDNLPAICLHGAGRPRYPHHSLPQSGYSHLYRYADAIHRVESWYSVCCQGNKTQAETLCCAQQAWEHALSQFCEEEFTIKTRHYHCCKEQGGARWSCFEKDAPNRSYLPTSDGSVAPQSPPEPGFTWNPNACRRSETSMAPRSFRKVPGFNFPPGRPTSSNIKWVCRLRKMRPRYNPKCLPSNAYGWLARQSKTINRLEKGLKQCCKGKNEVLACADGKWREVMDRYCKEEGSVKDSQFPCCKIAEGPQRYSCFSSRAPYPEYNYEILQREVSHTYLDLGLICHTHKQLTQRLPVQLPIKSIVKQCCHLPKTNRNGCVQGKLNDMLESKCAADKPLPPAFPPDCCTEPSREYFGCLSNMLIEALKKVTTSPGYKKCPLP